MSELILYTIEGGPSQIKLRAKYRTVWLFPLLTHAGEVGHAQDEAELKVLENTLQKRHKP